MTIAQLIADLETYENKDVEVYVGKEKAHAFGYFDKRSETIIHRLN